MYVTSHLLVHDDVSVCKISLENMFEYPPMPNEYIGITLVEFRTIPSVFVCIMSCSSIIYSDVTC
jgi:hypothetical protein